MLTASYRTPQDLGFIRVECNLLHFIQVEMASAHSLSMRENQQRLADTIRKSA